MRIFKHPLFITFTSLFLCICLIALHKLSSHSHYKPIQAVRLNITAQPSSLDPRKARSLNDLNIIRMLMDGLTRLESTHLPALSLAESMTLSDDKKTYTFVLKDAYWSNGEKIKAADFIYSWRSSLDPHFPSDNASCLYVIKNAELVKKGFLSSSALGLFSPDEKTLIIELEKPTPYFLDLLATPIFFPIHAKTDIHNYRWAEESSSYVGCGPFMIDEWKFHNLLTVKKNPKFWDHLSVHLDKIEMFMVSSETGFSMYQNKELDWEGSPFSQLPLDAIENLKKTHELCSQNFLITSFLRINTHRPPLHLPNFRKALSLSLNRNSLIEHVLLGSSSYASGIVPGALGLKEGEYFEDNNPVLAQSFLNTCSSYDSDIHKKQEIVLSFLSNDKNYRICQALQEQWRKSLGLCVRLEPIESKLFFSRVSRKEYELCLGSWVADFRDPINFLEIFKSKDIGTNNTGWENSQYQMDIEKASATVDLSERKNLLQQCEKILINEMPIIPLYHGSMNYIKNPELKNVFLSDTGSIDFKNAFFSH